MIKDRNCVFIKVIFQKQTGCIQMDAACSLSNRLKYYPETINPDNGFTMVCRYLAAAKTWTMHCFYHLPERIG